MLTFGYKARDGQGKIYQGTIEAASQVVAAQTLSLRGWTPLSIQPKGSSFSLQTILRKFSGVGETDRLVFTRQLATMITAGLTVTQTLDILRAQGRNEYLTEIIEEVLHAVEGGSTLSGALSRYPEVFNRVYVNLIKAGEASGNLDKVLLRLSENEEKQAEFRSKVKGAFVYPAIVLVVMGLVIVVIMTFVVPKLTLMYKELGAELPLPTKVMIAISEFLTTKWWLAVLLLGGFSALYRYFTSTEWGARRVAEISLKIPVIGNLKTQLELTELSRTLSLLISSGLPILEAISIVAGAIDNLVYKEALMAASKQVERGVNLSVPLKQEKCFPPIFSQMVAVGEETGKLDEVLSKVSYFFEREADSTVRGLTVSLEPLIMIVLGLAVGSLVISVILPIYKLTAQF